MPRKYLFTFVTADDARVFVTRVVLRCRDVALFVDAHRVRVVDGAEEDQRELLYQLAMVTGARTAERG